MQSLQFEIIGNVSHELEFTGFGGRGAVRSGHGSRASIVVVMNGEVLIVRSLEPGGKRLGVRSNAPFDAALRSPHFSGFYFFPDKLLVCVCVCV